MSAAIFHMRNDKILRLNEISKSFGGIKALNYCSIDIEKGTITGLVGPNGAGKTTLFNTITGFFKPDAGEIFFKDEKIDGLPPAKVFNKKIVRTFQIPRTLQLMTVLDNIMIVPSGQIGERIWGPWLRPIFVRKQEKQIKERIKDIKDLKIEIQMGPKFVYNEVESRYEQDPTYPNYFYNYVYIHGRQ